LGDPVKTKEIGVACSTYWESRDACRVLLGKPEVKEHLQHIGVGGRITLILTPKK